MNAHPGLHPSPWPAEDGGPQRLQCPDGPGWGLRPGDRLTATSRLAIASTMVVLRDPGEVYLLCHTSGADAVSWVEQIDPVSLETIRRSAELPGGRTWPGGLAVHGNGDIYVAFGRHVHRLTPMLDVVASRRLPRDRPYNSFVVLPDGHLVTKDFAGATPMPGTIDPAVPSQVVVMRPDDLEIVASCGTPEPSIARLSASGNDIYVVGDQSILRIRWDGSDLVPDESFTARYRTLEGQSFAWDAVITDDSAWFLDDGAGSEKYAGSFVGIGVNECPLHLVRVDLASSAVTLTEVCGRPGGLIANPPAIDPSRRIAVGYDSSNACVTAFRYGDGPSMERLWQISLAHAAHPVVLPDTGELVLCDHDLDRGTDQVVVLDIETGEERARCDTGSPLQSVLFMAPGWERDLYVCSFSTVSRIHLAG